MLGVLAYAAVTAVLAIGFGKIAKWSRGDAASDCTAVARHRVPRPRAAAAKDVTASDANPTSAG